jgi:type IV secretory pathway VirB9-like protein
VLLTPSEITDSSFSIQGNQDRTAGWAGVHAEWMSFFQSDELRKWVLLNSKSSTTIFCNKSYVTDIHPSKQIMDLRTNGGSIASNKECTVKDLNLKSWYNPEAVTNILSLAEVSDKYRITYDNGKGMITVHLTDEKKIIFKRAKNNLYFYKPEEDQLNGNVFVTTVKENK